MNQNKSQIVGASEFNLSDHKHPLSSPHDLMSVPVKPFNNNIFTRSLSSSTSSPSLQLNLNNSLNKILEENGSVHLSAAATSPHMSASALLQIAAQMGATVSNSNAGMVMSDKTIVATNMMSSPPLFGMVQQQGHSFMNHTILKPSLHKTYNIITSTIKQKKHSSKNLYNNQRWSRKFKEKEKQMQQFSTCHHLRIGHHYRPHAKAMTELPVQRRESVIDVRRITFVAPLLEDLHIARKTTDPHTQPAKHPPRITEEPPSTAISLSHNCYVHLPRYADRAIRPGAFYKILFQVNFQH